jgi:hypothetical protein
MFFIDDAPECQLWYYMVKKKNPGGKRRGFALAELWFKIRP